MNIKEKQQYLVSFYELPHLPILKRGTDLPLTRVRAGCTVRSAVRRLLRTVPQMSEAGERLGGGSKSSLRTVLPCRMARELGGRSPVRGGGALRAVAAASRPRDVSTRDSLSGPPEPSPLALPLLPKSGPSVLLSSLFS